MGIPYFNTREFGEVLYFGAVGVAGIWSNGYSESEYMAGSKPEFVFREADAIGIDVGSTTSRDGNDYKVRVIERDGTGFAVMHLEKQ